LTGAGDWRYSGHSEHAVEKGDLGFQLELWIWRKMWCDYDCGIFCAWSLVDGTGCDMIPLNNDFDSSCYYFAPMLDRFWHEDYFIPSYHCTQSCLCLGLMHPPHRLHSTFLASPPPPTYPQHIIQAHVDTSPNRHFDQEYIFRLMIWLTHQSTQIGLMG
jgi:hypothetical protein